MKRLLAYFKRLWFKHTICVKSLSSWRDDLAWCPSQCYREVEFEGKRVMLYLRWRHENPWQGHVVENAPFDKIWEGDWSPDLFEHYHYFFTDNDDLSKIKTALIICADRWLKESEDKK